MRRKNSVKKLRFGEGGYKEILSGGGALIINRRLGIFKKRKDLTRGRKNRGL